VLQLYPFSAARLHHIIVKRERKPTRCNNQMFIINICLNMFRASLCPSSGEQRPCVTACEYCSHPTTQRPNRYQPHPAEPAHTPHAVTHGLCSPEDGHNDARNMLRQLHLITLRYTKTNALPQAKVLCENCAVLCYYVSSSGISHRRFGTTYRILKGQESKKLPLRATW